MFRPLAFCSCLFPTAGSSCERLCINDNWRFSKGDPTNVNQKTCSMMYAQLKKAETKRNAWRKPPWTRLGFSRNASRSQAVDFAFGQSFPKRPSKAIYPASRKSRQRHALCAAVSMTAAGAGEPAARLGHSRTVQLRRRRRRHGPSAESRHWLVSQETRHSGGRRRKEIFLDVDGAMSYAAVWLNGKLVGGWPYGYASWRLDLTPFVKFGGDNQLAIRVDNPPDFSRWYPGAGIYRNVWLVKTSPVHVGQWGTYLTTPKVSTTSATINLEVAVDNDSKARATVR